MKNTILSKILFVFTLAMLFNISSSNIVMQTIKELNFNFFDDFDVRSDAARRIQETLKEENPYRIYVTYNLLDGQPISVTTKVHYSGYREKPSFDKQVFTNQDCKPDSIVEFVYNKTDKGHIVQINKRTNQNLPKTQTLAFKFDQHKKSKQTINV